MDDVVVSGTDREEIREFGCAAVSPATYRQFHRSVEPDAYRLTNQTIGVLHHLANAGPLTVTEAAAHLDRSQSAMTEMIDRMETRGLIARIDDERDRRRTLI